jgi:capsular polysaccharide biosynthesis protein
MRDVGPFPNGFEGLSHEEVFQTLSELRDGWETVKFFSGMQWVLGTYIPLTDPRSSRLLFRYGVDCFEGGKHLVNNLTSLEKRGSSFASNTLEVLSSTNEINFLKGLMALKDLSDSTKDLLCFLARINFSRTDMDRALTALGESLNFQVLSKMDIDSGTELSFQNEGKYPSQKIMEIFEDGAWVVKAPKLKSVERTYVKLLHNAVTFGESSLVLTDAKAFFPWQEYSLASENIMRNDSFVVAIGSDYVVTRNLPSASRIIRGQSLSMTSDSANHFGHFCVENLPRLNALKAMGDGKPKTATIDISASQFEILIRRIEPKLSIQRIDCGAAVLHDELYVAMPSRFTPSDLTWGAPFLHHEMDQTISQPTLDNGDLRHIRTKGNNAGKLALMRADTGEAPYRKLRNTVEITDYLESCDFRLVKQTDLLLSNLEVLVADSQFIVAEAGSSLAINLMLMDVNGKSILLLQPPALGRQEARMAGVLASRGADIAVVVGESESLERQADFDLKISLIRAGLDRLNLRASTGKK